MLFCVMLQRCSVVANLFGMKTIQGGVGEEGKGRVVVDTTPTLESWNANLIAEVHVIRKWSSSRSRPGHSVGLVFGYRHCFSSMIKYLCPTIRKCSSSRTVSRDKENLGSSCQSVSLWAHDAGEECIVEEAKWN